MMEMPSSFELYIHIPFCVRKCEYCDFLSFPAGAQARAGYLEALCREIRLAGAFVREGEAGAGPAEVSTIFIGGGTPSLLGADQAGLLMEQIFHSFSVSEQAEITIESNPGTLDAEKLRAYRRAGINRLSVGCQSMHDRELIRMGRVHDHAAFLRSYELARSVGFDNINIDLIFGLPGQSEKDWQSTLRKAVRLAPEHISAYGLILEEGTPFYERRASLELPDEDTERAMYEMTGEMLSRSGYHQYEISNYARSGAECRHNIGYWTGVPYLGLGLGAASCWPETGQVNPGLTGRMLRFSQTTDPERYRRACGMQSTAGSAGGSDGSENERRAFPGDTHEITEYLTETDQMAEFMILGLRMTEGICENDFRLRFQREIDQVYADVIRKYECAQLLVRQDGRIRLTRAGQSLANVVMSGFL